MRARLGSTDPLPDADGLQGYLAHERQAPRRTLQQAYVQRPMVVLGGGLFFMSEVPLYLLVSVELRSSTQHASEKQSE